jgi:hypothetical protein
LQSLLRLTPESHPHYEKISETVDTMAHLGMALNESKRRKEMFDQLECLQLRLQTKGGKDIEPLFKLGGYSPFLLLPLPSFPPFLLPLPSSSFPLSTS